MDGGLVRRDETVYWCMGYQDLVSDAVEGAQVVRPAVRQRRPRRAPPSRSF